eukprot:m.316144 g.316144  ORF g.316144 m.316144 type:complete len:121 (+) comp55458_c2_seq38:46-408(+)
MRPLNPSTKPQSLSPRKSEALVHFHRVFSNRMNGSNGRPVRVGQALPSHSPGPRCCDLLEMIAHESFDAVIEKGTQPYGAQSEISGTKYTNISRIVRGNGGVVSITVAQPHFCSPFDSTP